MPPIDVGRGPRGGACLSTGTQGGGNGVLDSLTSMGEPAMVLLGDFENTAPQGTRDAYEVSGRLEVGGRGVLDNDIDPGCVILQSPSDPKLGARLVPSGPQELTARLVSGLSHGTLTLRADGVFSYQPDPGFVGTDSFDYQPADMFEGGTVASVSLAVTPSTAEAVPVSAAPQFTG